MSAAAPIPSPSPFTGKGNVEHFAVAKWMLKMAAGIKPE